MGKVKDLTGQQFGKLIVIKDTGKRKNRQVVWECQCECGSITEVVGQALRTGHTQSCGCYAKQRASEHNLIDITGQKFNYLTAIKDTGERKNRAAIWLFQCDCGNFIECLGTEVRNGYIKSCGCGIATPHFRTDLTNQKFGKLTVLRLGGLKNDKRCWICQCDCGSVIEVPTGSLTSGNTTSCGCIKSKGEEKISNILSSYNISFERQKTFESCIYPATNGKLLFDFYVDNKYLIEFDGSQHFDPTSEWYRPEYDKYKDQWCKDNNIPLIRIPYTKLDTLTIEDIKLETSEYVIHG